MTQVWLFELLKGAGKIFLHPLFFYFFLAAAYLGVSRVKRERKNFHVRAENAYFELKQLLPAGLAIGLILSVISVGIGLAVPFAAIVMAGVLTFIFSLAMNARFLSSAYTVGLAVLILFILSEYGTGFEWLDQYFSGIGNQTYAALAVLLGMLLVGEGLLIGRNGSKGTSPKLVKSKRGQTIGVHEAQRIWILPVFLLIPGNALEPLFGWWPVFSIGEELFSLILVPFGIGFREQISGMLPKVAVRMYGGRVIALGFAVLAISVAGYWYPVAGLAAAAAALIGRLFISSRMRKKDANLPSFFAKQNDSVMILGVVPDSPAAKMGLQAGEHVKRVNGATVKDEASFYEAIQRNAAHCKLEVIDVNGQVRHVQRALYEGNHHQLGILFVQDEKKWDSAVV